MTEPTPETHDHPPDLQTQLDEARQQIAERDSVIASLERRGRIDQLLRDADTIDIEAARLLTEVAIEQMDDADIERAVNELRRKRPYLFRANTPDAASGGAQSPAVEPKPSTRAQQAAEEAVVTGRRDDLLRYLRLRRRK